MLTLEERFNILQKIEKKELSSTNIGKAKNELSRLRETVKLIMNSASELEDDLQSINAVGLLADIQRQFSVFVEKYMEVLDKLAVSASKEAVFLEKISSKIDGL